MKQFDVLVVGGGHAGCEAAYFAAKMGCKTGLVTLDAQKIGVMSCNPAIGGVGKGHLVREIDALGGVMAQAADASGIQFRLLNRKKGPAVQGPRTQSDRDLYRQYMQKALKNLDKLQIIQAEIADLIIDNRKISGAVLADGSEIHSHTVILTTGTFLNGIIHMGLSQKAGGRIGDDASERLAARLYDLVPSVGRLKTGTPPRLISKTIAWDMLEKQPGDEIPELFSFFSTSVIAEQISCGITKTNTNTHEIISKNLDKTALFGGEISGQGPRYCPSIEDKITRFPDKTSHQIYLEPEGLNSTLVYPNGISTSLDPAIQTDLVRSIAGLENAEIAQPGYAIEYDYVDPRALSQTLELRDIQGLFLAGQINGTTGYEEAAAQGAVAGINAARMSQGLPEIVFSRSDSYIGVMIDDLTGLGVTEPYRMFTSRAEFRLRLRHDNADRRLTPIGWEIGSVDDNRWQIFCEKIDALDKAETALKGTLVTARELNKAGVRINPDGKSRNLYDVFSLPKVQINNLESFLGSSLDGLPRRIKESLLADAQYAPYLQRQEQDMDKLRRDEGVKIPSDFVFKGLPGLSNELAEKLTLWHPENLAQASRIEGMTPAALMLILSKVKMFGASNGG